MKQSRIMSMVEAATNVLVGYFLAIATQIVVFPWFGIVTGLAEHLTIGLAFVGVSLARGYFLRRVFEAIRVKTTRPPLDASGGHDRHRLRYRRDFGPAIKRDQPSKR